MLAAEKEEKLWGRKMEEKINKEEDEIPTTH